MLYTIRNSKAKTISSRKIRRPATRELPSGPCVQAPVHRFPVTLQRPFVDVTLVQFVLNCSEDDVLARIQEGGLTAVDLRTKRAKRACVRILSDSVVAASRGKPRRCDTAQFQQTVETIFPPHYNPATSALAQTFTCGSSHIFNLIREKSLQRVGPAPRPGPGGSCTIDRTSVIKLLCDRYMA